MNRYTGKTLMVEMAMIAGTIAFCFPLYILVNIAIKAPNEGTLAITPAQSPTFSNLIDPAPVAPITRKEKVGRNDPCPCGSGKKFKKCCMNKKA